VQQRDEEQERGHDITEMRIQMGKLILPAKTDMPQQLMHLNQRH